jgi:hypothetical protein
MSKSPWQRNFEVSDTEEGQEYTISTKLKLCLIAFGILVAGHVEYKSEVAMEEMARQERQIRKLEIAAALYLPPMQCSSCHNMRVGATKEPK